MFHVLFFVSGDTPYIYLKIMSPQNDMKATIDVLFPERSYMVSAQHTEGIPVIITTNDKRTHPFDTSSFY